MTVHVWRPGGDNGWPSSGWGGETAGMFLAGGWVGRRSVGWDEASWVSRVEKITGFDADDRQVLSDWLTRARADGIDKAIDLAGRPWRIDGPRAIVGVFEKAKDQASWLIVRDSSGWVLISCEDGFVSDVSAALSDVLALIDVSSVNLY